MNEEIGTGIETLKTVAKIIEMEIDGGAAVAVIETEKEIGIAAETGTGSGTVTATATGTTRGHTALTETVDAIGTPIMVVTEIGMTVEGSETMTRKMKNAPSVENLHARGVNHHHHLQLKLLRMRLNLPRVLALLNLLSHLTALQVRSQVAEKSLLTIATDPLIDPGTRVVAPGAVIVAVTAQEVAVPPVVIPEEGVALPLTSSLRGILTILMR